MVCFSDLVTKIVSNENQLTKRCEKAVVPNNILDDTCHTENNTLSIVTALIILLTSNIDILCLDQQEVQSFLYLYYKFCGLFQ